MKLVTFNINGIRARMPRLVEYLAREQPDIVCLQELKCADESLPIGDIEAAGYRAVWHGQKGFNGVAILARGDAPALRQVGLPDDPDDSHSRYIEAEVARPDRRVDLSAQRQSRSAPTSSPTNCAGWSGSRARAAELLAEERPVVLAGDYNVIPEDRDTFSRRAMANDALFQPESQAAFRALVHQGWTDALRAIHPREPRLYTFWDYQAGALARDAGFRIDHLLLSPQAADRLRGAGVDKWARAEEKASDHAPTWVDLA